MGKQNWIWAKIGLVVLLSVVIILGYGGLCSLLKNDDKSGSSIGALQVRGKIGTNYQAFYIPPLRFFDRFLPPFMNTAMALYGSGTQVDKVIAIPYEGGYLGPYCVINRKETTINNQDGTFSLSLEKDRDWVLLLVNTAGTTPDEKFVGYVAMNVLNTDGLLNIPVRSAVTSNLDLGDLDKTGDTALSDSTVTTTDFSLTASQLFKLAKNDDMLKLIKNLFLNYNYTNGIYYVLRPDYKWRGNYASISNTYEAPISYTYVSYQFQFDSNTTELTIDKLAGTNGQTKVIVELLPPVGAEIPTKNGNITYTSISPISNAVSMTKTQRIDGSWEVGGQDFYAGEWYGNLSYSPGSANLVGTIPAGYWVWKIGGVTKGQFDVAVASPITGTNKIKGCVPSIRLNVTISNTITSITVKWYILNDAGDNYVEVTDATLLRTLVSGGNMYIENTTGGIRKYDSINSGQLNPQMTYIPQYTWYYGNNGPENEQAKGIGIFYSTGGVGYFYEWFK